MLHRPYVIAALGMGIVVLARLYERSLPTPDFPGWQTTAMIAAIWFLALTVVIALGRFLSIWAAVSALLLELVRLPMVQAYDRIPPQFSRAFGRYLDQIRPSLTSLTIPVHQWATVAERFYAVAPDLEARWLAGLPAQPDAVFEALCIRLEKAITLGDPDSDQDTPSAGQAAAAVQAIFETELTAAAASQVDELAKSQSRRGLRCAALACLDLLTPVWDSAPPAEGFGEKTDDPSNATKSPGEGTDRALQDWVKAAEDLIALEVVMRISQCMVHLKNLAYYLAFAPILLLLAVNSYPFQPERFLQVCLWTILLGVVASVLAVYVGMERDELLSRVSKTRPNAVEFDRTFLTNVLAFVIPVAGIVLAQFPYVSDMLNQWLGPMITGVLS
jgi:uncharacterized membrane protein